MSKNRLLKLFLNYLNPPVDINGLILNPQVGFDSIIWDIENPDNLSYSTEVVEGYLQELLYQFQISTGTKDLPEWKNCWDKYCRVNDSDVYINRELSNPQIEKIGEIDNDTLSEFIEEFRYNDTSQEQETDLLWKIIIPIMDDPNMYDRDYMFSVGLIEFYDNFGDKLG